jgi:hypothetical protein
MYFILWNLLQFYFFKKSSKYQILNQYSVVIYAKVYQLKILNISKIGTKNIKSKIRSLSN